MMYKSKANLLITVLILVCSFTFQTSTVSAYNPSDFNWVEGGKRVEIGNHLGEIYLEEQFLFLPVEELKRFQTVNNNLVSGYEVGSIHPVNLEENWFVMFEYYPVGHVSDSESEIDADKLLDDYISSTDKSNENRSEMPVEIIGWHEKPKYNPDRHELFYSILFKDVFGNTQINHITRLLSRHGYMSINLITDTTRFEQDLITLNQMIIPHFKWNESYAYQAFSPSVDLAANITLVELIYQSLGIPYKQEKNDQFLLFTTPAAIAIGVIVVVVVVVVVVIFINKKKRS